MNEDIKVTMNQNRLADSLVVAKKRSWEKYVEPFQMLDNVYCIATNFASQYLVKTTEGLVLLDAGWNEMTPFTIDSIHRLGFDPRDITHMFLTHGHFDHIGGARVIQEISHCKTYMPPDDMFFLDERRDLIGNEENVPEFKVDELYDYKTVYQIGDAEFWAVHCPGHTPGTSTICYKTKHRGKDVICALHGGSGLNFMGRKDLKAKRLPYSLQKQYVESMRKVIGMHVDVVTPAHQFGHSVIDLKQKDDGTGSVFIDETAWSRLMSNTLTKFMEVYGTELELPDDKD